jgi:hypothetical protein
MVGLVRKESNDKTRERIERDLNTSAANYADYAENMVSKLQQAYFRKYQPQQHANSANGLRHPQDIPNKRFGRMVSALFCGRWEDSREPEHAKAVPSEPEEGDANITHGLFQLGFLNQPTALVSYDDCREAVTRLNKLRWKWAENLGDGYDVSRICCCDIY